MIDFEEFRSSLAKAIAGQLNQLQMSSARHGIGMLERYDGRQRRAALWAVNNADKMRRLFEKASIAFAAGIYHHRYYSENAGRAHAEAAPPIRKQPRS